MSLEIKIEDLTSAIKELIEVIKDTAVEPQVSAPVSQPVQSQPAEKNNVTKGKPKAKVNPREGVDGKAVKNVDPVLKSDPEPVADPEPDPVKPASTGSTKTLSQLKALLQEFREEFGLPKAKRLLPDLGYDNSSSVPEDKVDEVYEQVMARFDQEKAESL